MRPSEEDLMHARIDAHSLTYQSDRHKKENVERWSNRDVVMRKDRPGMDFTFVGCADLGSCCLEHLKACI